MPADHYETSSMAHALRVCTPALLTCVSMAIHLVYRSCDPEILWPRPQSPPPGQHQEVRSSGSRGAELLAGQRICNG